MELKSINDIFIFDGSMDKDEFVDYIQKVLKDYSSYNALVTTKQLPIGVKSKPVLVTMLKHLDYVAGVDEDYIPGFVIDTTFVRDVDKEILGNEFFEAVYDSLTDLYKHHKGKLNKFTRMDMGV